MPYPAFRPLREYILELIFCCCFFFSNGTQKFFLTNPLTFTKAQTWWNSSFFFQHHPHHHHNCLSFHFPTPTFLPLSPEWLWQSSLEAILDFSFLRFFGMFLFSPEVVEWGLFINCKSLSWACLEALLLSLAPVSKSKNEEWHGPLKVLFE